MPRYTIRLQAQLITLFAYILCYSCAYKQTEKVEGAFLDERDGREYRTVKIGKQWWMAENLAYKPNFGVCLVKGNDPEHIAEYGYLYDYNTGCNVCPIGWHLPSNEEWLKMTKYIGGENIAGRILKAKEKWEYPGIGTDDFGFAALPGSHHPNSDPYLSSPGQYGLWWTSTSSNEEFADTRALNKNTDAIIEGSLFKHAGLSVRCVQDSKE